MSKFTGDLNTMKTWDLIKVDVHWGFEHNEDLGSD